MPFFSCTVEEQPPPNLRIDRYVSECLKLLTRSQIRARSLTAKVNGKDVKLSRPVKCGDIIELLWNDAPPAENIPQDIPLDIVYENTRCVVINKEQGMVVHPGAGNRQNTLANAICFRKLEKNNKKNDAGIRPGIVHRLDKETSGIIIAAYDDEALVFLSEQFKMRKVRKTYMAIVQGVLCEKKGRIETFIARDGGDRKKFSVSTHGKNALTFFKVIKTWQNHTLVMLRPKTGRTHQLRVHLRHLGHPVLGDAVYGYADKKFPDSRLMLHSRSLAIILPGETEERLFVSPVPDRFRKIIRKLNEGSHG
ncbi:MAG: RluA family pseudouridine synthase [Treponema sp.]|jgi:23S rRNA pseudouridine1911/1915/1917 synthase|nr:RluA family pseudouridine synthase [Treponema sp.]